KRDEEAFLILYRRHQGPVFRFALHMSGSRDTAEDVTQEVFMAMLTEADKYLPDHSPLQAYLIGIARNHVRRHLRTIRERPDRIGPDSGSHGDYLIDELSRDQDLTALRKAILSLPPAYREIIVLCDLESIDYVNAASQLGCPVGTVRSRLHRARVILQAKLCGREKRQRSGGCVV
ncbi:MAG: RNA polymerase sigma factor, partial [Acidobacteriaceae bacterium]|nr:RNA polymerase sigma factor [Acidobacteriaceae bacterium]